MRKLTACMLSVLASLTIGAVAARAQSTTAQISGQVTDSTAAAVPQASVTITNVDTAQTRKAETSGAGYYVIPLLPPGNYKLTVEKQGFQKTEIPGLILQVNQALSQDVALKVGSVTQSVTVGAQAPQLQSTSSNLGAVITTKAIVDLPLNGRNFTQLLILTPGVTPVSTGQFASVGAGLGSNAGIPGTTFSMPSVGGGWARANIYLLDSLNFTSWYVGTYTVLPILDAIQEFKVQSHNDSAEYGGALGGIFNVVTKSGTNGLHGSAWEFVRNDVFDARNPFTESKRTSPAPYRENSFGFTVGGPVVVPKVYNGKNKTWFYVGYEGWRYRKPAAVLSRYPTTAELNGDFTSTYTTQMLYDPATTREDPSNPGTYIRDPFVCDAAGSPVAQGTAGATACNKIPTDRISSMTQGWLQASYDSPNLTGNPTYNYLTNAGEINDNNTWFVKADQRIGDHDTASFRLSEMGWKIRKPLNSKVTNLINSRPIVVGGGETHLFSPTLILDSRFGFNMYSHIGYKGPNGGKADYFDSLGYAGSDRFGVVTLGLGSPWTSLTLVGPQNQVPQDYNLAETLTWVHGKHTVKGGLQWSRLRQWCCGKEDGYGQNNQYGFSYSQTGIGSGSSTGSPLASALLGVPNNMTLMGQRYDFHVTSFAPFIEDKIQLTPKLSLTVGLRYDYAFTPSIDKETVSTLDPATGNWLISGGKLPGACDTTLTAPCIPGDGDLADISYGNHIVLAPNKNIGPVPTRDNIGPRVGLAWRATEKTVIRGGYGLVYGTTMGTIQAYQALIGLWPNATSASSTYNAVGASLTTIGDLQSVTLSRLPSASPWTTRGYFVDPNIKTPRSQQWNVGVQHQMANNLMLSLAYVGSKSDRLNVTGVFNVASKPSTGTAAEVAALRPFPWAPVTYMARSIGLANYNSLQFSAEKRYSDGLQFLMAYTFSRATDAGGSGLFNAENGTGGSAAVQNPNDLSNEWGVSGYDVTHYLSAAVQYDLPAGKGKRFLQKGPASWILGNWQMNAITSLRSGQPFNPYVQGDVANIGVGSAYNYARPNLVGDPELENPTPAAYFNTAAFSTPSYSYGNSPKNVLRSASVYNVDFSLFKKFPITETVGLEFRAEAFNIFNIQNWGVPGALIGSTSAGVISSTVVAPRELQFALKVRF